MSPCDAKKVPAALDALLGARFADAGLWGVTPPVDEVERACGRRPTFAPGFADLLALGAGDAGPHGDCALFDAACAASPPPRRTGWVRAGEAPRLREVRRWLVGGGCGSREPAFSLA
ncbi:MAG: hypothetical protein AB1730_08495 [Myxococcota bacterium]